MSDYFIFIMQSLLNQHKYNLSSSTLLVIILDIIMRIALFEQRKLLRIIY